ncbi:MAG: ComEC/Rec2 family competence protein, partial [Boseongicola sp.]|nr:ComEC/Rec2 family competence protein [Boseongicola sp.]
LLQIGAVGYTRNPVLQMAEGELTGFWLRVTHLRLAISSHIVAMLPGRTGAFAAAVTTGDRSGMDQETLEALRASNLAHLLAISGLHMGLLSGFVFAAVRVGLSLFGTLALRWPVKKVAALCGLAAASVYLLLSGGNVATERAFIQVGVMFLAVLADRRAITLRAVALAALIVLVLRPESLLSPGFQMSFAATTALVATYSWLRDYDWQGGRWSKTSRFIGGVALTSFVAGMATAPFAAAHFNQVPHYGLIANILSVPVMGMIVIPGAVLAACLAPIGLEWIGLAIMSPAINWILLVASEVSELPRSLSHVPSPSPWVLPTLSMGCLWFVIWRGRLKFFGAVPILAAFFLWSQVERPQILISETGGLMGVLGEGGRILTKAKGEGFAASSWLENDGDAVVQVTAHERLDVSQKPSRLRSFDVAGVSVVHATGNKAASVALANCEDTNIVVVNVDALASDHCQVFDKNRLAQTGAIALYISNGEIREQSARAEQGTRLWSQ